MQPLATSNRTALELGYRVAVAPVPVPSSTVDSKQIHRLNIAVSIDAGSVLSPSGIYRYLVRFGINLAGIYRQHLSGDVAGLTATSFAQAS